MDVGLGVGLFIVAVVALAAAAIVEHWRLSGPPERQDIWRRLLSRLNGWQRIGVVLSVSWAIFVIGAVTVHVARGREIRPGELVEACAWIIGPILAAWVIAYLFVFAAKWVSRGFQNTRGGSTSRNVTRAAEAGMANARVLDELRRCVFTVPVWVVVVVIALVLVLAVWLGFELGSPRGRSRAY